ncbi:STAS-like domain-containing protein [Empedobacter falsenii]
MKILELFGRFTGLRYVSLSEKSGEEFYHNYLNEIFKENIDSKTVLTVDLDGIRGYSPSFIDEVFGNLIYDFGDEYVNKYLLIKSDNNQFWIDSIKNETFKNWSIRRKKGDEPKKTDNHNEWWRLVDGEFIKKKWINI